MKIEIKPDNTKSLIKPPETERFKFGCVELAPGKNMGLHCTDKKEELITAIQGEVTVVVDGEEEILHEREAYYIKRGVEHDVINKTDETVIYTYTVVLLE